MSIDTGASPYFMPCEQCNRWIEIFVRDEFNQPFVGVSGTLTDSAGNEFSVILGEAPIYLEGLASGPVLLHLDSEQWLLESQKDEHKPNVDSKPTVDFANEYVNQEGAKPKFIEITAGDLTELAKGQSLPSRHEKGKADPLELITDNSYVLQVRGFNFITLRVGMFFDGTANNSYSAQWGKKELDKYYYKWRPKYEAECELISKRTGLSKNDIPITVLSDDCFAYPQEKGFFQKLFTGDDGDTETVEGSATNELTNIQKLYDLYLSGKFDKDKRTYLHSEYITGIGTGNSQAIEPADESLLGQGTGIGKYGVTAKVTTGIEQLEESIADFSGDISDTYDGINKLQFDVFGFSRGAAAARHFINVVLDGECGEFGQAFNKACKRNNLVLSTDFDWGESSVENSSCEITFAGLFDTVASVVHLFSLDSETLLDVDFSTHSDNGKVRLWLDPERVRNAVHLTADPTLECRYNFSLNRLNTATHFKELELPGAHSDIGGGYQCRMSYSKKDYLLPLLEKKRIKRVSRSYSNSWEKKRAIKYVCDKLDEYRLLDQKTGWSSEHYSEPELSFRRMGDHRQIVTGNLYIKRAVEGELSRLYLRLMYGLCLFHKVPFVNNEDPTWTTNPHYVISDKSSEFKQLNEKVLECAILGNYDELVEMLSNQERRQEFLELNLVHHSSDDSMAFKPLYDERQERYMRASYDCEEGK